MSLTDKPLSFAEFFAGIGLMRLGLERAGWSVAFANDIDEDKFQMYRDHFSDAGDHFVLGDIHKLNAEDVPSVDLATASFPCNDLSLAGMRDGLNGRQSSAFWGFIDILERMGARRPPLVLLENVAGFLTSHGGEDFRSALQALNRLGYAVDAVILDAARFVPQSRARLFVIGSQQHETARADDRLPPVPDSTLRPPPLREFIQSNPSIHWDIHDLPEPPSRTKSLPDILEDLDHASPVWWSGERTVYLMNQMSAKHADALRELTRKRRWSYATVFRRMRDGRSMAEIRTDGVAGCLRTPRGGSGRQILLKAGFGKVRARLLTPRECARLMGADDFNVEVTLNKALFGFGDAVCVPVITWLGGNYLKPLAENLFQPEICFTPQLSPSLRGG